MKIALEDLELVGNAISGSILILKSLNMAIKWTNNGIFTRENNTAITKRKIKMDVEIFNSFWKEIEVV